MSHQQSSIPSDIAGAENLYINDLQLQRNLAQFFFVLSLLTDHKTFS